jgi:hypothetical protein
MRTARDRSCRSEIFKGCDARLGHHCAQVAGGPRSSQHGVAPASVQGG